MDYTRCDFDITGIDKMMIDANCLLKGTYSYHLCSFSVKPGRMKIPYSALNHALIWGIIEGIGKENVIFMKNFNADHGHEDFNADHFYQIANNSPASESQEVVTHVTKPILEAKATESGCCSCCIL